MTELQCVDCELVGSGVMLCRPIDAPLCGPCFERRFPDDPDSSGSRDHKLSPTTSWAPVDLGRVLDGTQPDPSPAILTRTDGRALLYAGRVHALFGEPEACKGWIALTAAAEALGAGARVLYVDFEDTAASVTSRVMALGVARDVIRERFVYVRPDEPLEKAGRGDLEAAAAGAVLAVLDGITEALTLHGLDLASNGDVAAWLDLLPRPLARTGAAVLTIDHVVKDRENRGRYAIGAQHKLAGVDCAYSVHVIEPFGRGRDGKVKITVTKDRPGHVRAFADEGRAAEARLQSHDDGTVTVTLKSPEGAGVFRPTTLMERVSRAVEDEPGVGTNAIRRTIKGKARFVQEALARLIEEGHVDCRRDGDGKAVRHYSIRPFRADDDTVSQPRPDHVPETVSGTASPRPLPYGGRGHGRGADEHPDPDNRVPLATPDQQALIDRLEAA
jgi:AAA domain